MDVFPFEIIEEILEILKSTIALPEDDRFTGGLSRYGIANTWWMEPQHSRTVAQQIKYDWERSGGKKEDTEQPNEEKYRQYYKDLLSLRLVNRTFYEICTPYIFRELNLFDPCDDLTKDIAKKYGMHVRILRISLENDDKFSERGTMRLEGILAVIRLCPQIRALALCYVPGNVYEKPQTSSLTGVLEPFLLSSQYKHLDTIGVYTPLSANTWPNSQKEDIQRQIFQLAHSERAHMLRRLDVSLPSMSENDLQVIRTKFTCLERLTIHGNLWELFRSLTSSNISLLNYSNCAQLTTLRLMGDFAGMCIQLLDVVRTSPSITRLFVSDMGKYLGMNLGLRPPGWSNLVDGWWYRRKPLAELHIRAALPQVVYRLGTIPASKVWLTLPKFSIKDSTFVHDEEIFPQMQNMTMMNFTPSPTPYSSINPDFLVYARTMYTGRGVIVEGESSSTLKEVYDPTVSNYLLSNSRRT